MIRIIIFFFLGQPFLLGQTPRYNQVQVDTFSFSPLNKETLGKFKNILENDDRLFGWSKYYTFLGYHKMKEKERDSALFYSKIAIDYFEKQKTKRPNEEKSLTHAYYTIGYINRLNGLYNWSTTNLLMALDLANKYKVNIKPYILSSIAANHLSMGNNRQAVKYYKQCIKDTFYIRSAQAEVSAQTRLGILFSKTYLNKPDSAYYYYQKALKRSLNSNYKNNLYAINGSIADLFRDTDLDSTLFYYRQSINAYKQFVFNPNASNTKTEFYNDINKSYINIYDNKIDNAIFNLKSIIDTLQPTVIDKNDRDMISMAYENLILAYERKNELYNANTTLKKQLVFENDFFKIKLNQELEDLQVSYETAKKEEEILDLKNKAEQTKKIIRQQRIITYSFLALGALLFVLGFFIFRQRILRQKMKAISLEQRLLRSQMNPHFLSNALTTASLLVNTNAGQAINYIHKLAKLLRLTLENSMTEYVSLENEMKALHSYLDLQSNFSKDFDYEIIVDDIIEQEHVLVPPMLIQPFVENAFIHGVSKTELRGTIRIEIRFKEDYLICSVTDNGPGFPKKKEALDHKSMALYIVKERLALYQKKNKQKPVFEIKNRKVNNYQLTGIEVTFTLPFYKL